ncbi:TetR/AcrR family transcriptional regulator [Pseudactinotalea sp. Z1732]|uniref:TetR/AcrR family transcriptional regulator n=1 Tax=Micrococcales TaxID=85006 RepID=UPI003C7AD0ED
MRSKTRANGRQRSFIEQARRAQIVRAAIETVAETGYSGASLSRIARRAGISKSVISYHFAGKDDLLTQVVTDFFADTEAHMRAELAAARTATDLIRTWVSAQIDYFARHRAQFLAMTEIVMNHRDAAGARPFLEVIAGEVEAISRILTDGQRAGEFRDFVVTDVAVIIIRATEGVLGAWMADEHTDLDAQTAALIDFIDHAIRNQPPPNPPPHHATQGA